MKDWFSHKAAQNEEKKCLVNSCFNHRHKVSGYCKTHDRQRERYGHPLGWAINKREYMREQEDVWTFIDKHIGHPAIKAGIDWFNKLLADSASGLRVPAKAELNQLIREGVEGKACLNAVLSVWLFSERKPAILPDDIRLTFALANALFGTAHRIKIQVYRHGKQHHYYKPASHRAIKELGQYVRQNLAPLQVNVFGAILRDLAKEDEIINALHKPF